MKKMGVIIASAALLTIGGVYATFNYAQKDADAVSKELTLTLAGKSVETEKGTITVTSTFKLGVDDTAGDLHTYATYENKMVNVKFDAAQGADEDVVNNGIKLKMSFTVTGTNSFEGSDIITFPKGKEVALNEGNKTKAVDVDMSELVSVSRISLPTEAKYDAFKTAFDNLKLEFTVSELK